MPNDRPHKPTCSYFERVGECNCTFEALVRECEKRWPIEWPEGPSKIKRIVLTEQDLKQRYSRV